MRNFIPFYLLSLTLCIPAYAQEALTPPPSPLAVASMRYEDAYVKIVYSRPQKRGRKIFGELVPYGKVWRLGANEATEITLTRDLVVHDFPLPAGTYSLFAIPEPDRWTIIINSDLGMWGGYNYNPARDVTRFEVPVEEIPGVVFEPFTIRFDQHNESADMLILWDRTEIRVPIHFVISHP